MGPRIETSQELGSDLIQKVRLYIEEESVQAVAAQGYTIERSEETNEPYILFTLKEPVEAEIVEQAIRHVMELCAKEVFQDLANDHLNGAKDY